MVRNIILILACWCGTILQAVEKPNIIFIFADDLGYGDLACYGHPYANTPVLDQLAKEGTRFTQAYVTGVTCCPSRTGVMTGKFPATFAKYMSDHGFGNRVTITELLKRNGYRTGHFGKWHIGPETKNGTYGIDVINGKDRDARDRAEHGRDAYIIDAAIEFLEANAKKDEPLYMNVWGHITHFPVRPSKKFSDKFKDVVVDESEFNETMREKFQHCREFKGDIDEGMRNYLGDVWSMDAGIGRLLKKVDELSLRKSTIIVFSSDHGPAPVKLGGGRNEATSRIDAARNMLGSPGVYRGGKHTQFEGGVRVPFIIRWPGHVPAGRVNQTSVISFIDWLPTICQITGAKNSAPNLDGEDISDIWLGAKRTRTKPLFWRVGNANARPAVRAGDWKYYHYNDKKTGPMLYDLAKDPGEKQNLVKEKPQVALRLSNQIKDWISTLPKEYTKPNKQKKRDKKKK